MSTSTLVPPIQAGMKVRTRAIFPYPLPRGLAAGSEVIVVRMDENECVVRDHANREWTVGVVSLDPGQLVWMDGQWVPDGHS